MLCRGLLVRQSGSAKFFFEVVQCRLRLRSRAFKLQHLGIEQAQLSLHPQRARLGRAATAHHAALVRGAVGRDERVRWIFTREPFRHGSLCHKKRRVQPRQKLLCRRAQWIAEFHETVEPGDGLLFNLERHNRFVWLQIQFAQRVHEKRGPSADFLAEEGNARARDVECFHHNIFQFVAQKLFHRALVLLLDLGVIGQHAHSAEPRGIIAALN